MIIVEVLFLLCIVLLSAYGLNSMVLVLLYLRHRDDPTPSPPPPAEWPHVTVQLPVYNELHIVERLLAAAAALDYLQHRFEIQLLDDSTDETREIAARAVARLQEQGINVVHITRPYREDYKAGALAAGLAKAKGELIAVFDADFVPPPDFLQRVVPHFADPGVGCIQTRWGHLNRDYSSLTRAQALGIDGHFVVEQTARSRAGLFLNFSGTAGVWRRACIEDAGGWQGDTLTEDLDLSYRAQLRGWRIAYLPDVVVPAELPVQINALKRQQARWAQGSIETALKLIGPLFRSRQPSVVKLEGIVHLTGYLVHPLMLLTVLLTLPMSFSNSWVLSVSPWLMGMAAGPPLLYLVAQRRRPWRHRLRLLPLLELLGIGLALNNTWAVLRGMLGIRQGFLRTPKFALLEPADMWVSRRYALSGAPFMWGELLLSLFAVTLVIVPGMNLGFVPWLLLYAGSFGYVAGVSLYQSRQRLRWLATQPISTPHKEGCTPAGG
ncbi:MAG: glycosyltransferase [Anaerolineae bacterium]|jgi:cellulose synthase/poly-beta-1,6-N-acetylglucosamine synthase-like glycosyltransferase